MLVLLIVCVFVLFCLVNQQTTDQRQAHPVDGRITGGLMAPAFEPRPACAIRVRVARKAASTKGAPSEGDIDTLIDVVAKKHPGVFPRVCCWVLMK
jgi:hypothetical protein